MMHKYLLNIVFIKRVSLLLSSAVVKQNYVLVYKDDKVLANSLLTSIAAKESNKLIQQ